MDNMISKRSKEFAEAHQNLVPIKCKKCNCELLVKEYHILRNKKYSKNCDECLYEIHSKSLKEIRSRQTPEERSAFARKINKNCDKKQNVINQWKTIKSLPPEEYKEFCRKRSVRMKKVWDEQYTEETKKYILDSLTSSHDCGRSKLSNSIKNALIKENLYDNFISEEYFHGYYPDEINHTLKLIIEVYGEVYHCNPKKYTDPQEYVSFIDRTVQEQWDRDKKRIAVFYKHGYKVIIIWENDWYRNPQEQLERIKNEINKRKAGKDMV